MEEFPGLAENQDAAIDLIYEEFSVRSEIHKQGLVEEFIRRFPRLRRQLENQFAVHEAMLDTVSDQPLVPSPPPPAKKHFDLYREIGRGRTSVVYCAWDKERGHAVALKVLSPTILGLAGDAIHGLRKEAEILGRIRHPNVMTLFDVGDQDGWPFLVLEYVDGESLRKRLDGQPMPVLQVLQLAETLALALDQIHRHGVVHCDLSPSNIMLTRNGQPKIADFGLALLLANATGCPRQNNIIGTPCYMAPEQVTGQTQDLSPRSDIYSLGAILYELLAGRPPFKAETTHATFQQIMTQQATPLGSLVADLPAGLDKICHKCLRKDPSRRYDSALALAKDLRQVMPA